MPAPWRARPSTCNHCTDAPCVSIYPTNALFRRNDGIVDFDTSLCIGCKSLQAGLPLRRALHRPPRPHRPEVQLLRASGRRPGWSRPAWWSVRKGRPSRGCPRPDHAHLANGPFRADAPALPLDRAFAWALVGGTAAPSLVAVAELVSRRPTRNHAAAMHHLTRSAHAREWRLGGQVIGVAILLVLGAVFPAGPAFPSGWPRREGWRPW